VGRLLKTDQLIRRKKCHVLMTPSMEHDRLLRVLKERPTHQTVAVAVPPRIDPRFVRPVSAIIRGSSVKRR